MCDLKDFVQSVVVATAEVPMGLLQHALEVANCLVHEGGVTDGYVAAAAVLVISGLPVDDRDAFSPNLNIVVRDWASDRQWPETHAIELADILVHLRGLPRLSGLDRVAKMAALKEQLEDIPHSWVYRPVRRLHALADKSFHDCCKVKME